MLVPRPVPTGEARSMASMGSAFYDRERRFREDVGFRSNGAAQARRVASSYWRVESGLYVFIHASPSRTGRAGGRRL